MTQRFLAFKRGRWRLGIVIPPKDFESPRWGVGVELNDGWIRKRSFGVTLWGPGGGWRWIFHFDLLIARIWFGLTATP